MGANGSGKSTFLLCCTGICRPQKGKLLFDGKEVSYDRKSLLHLRSKVGLVFQDPDTQLFSASVYQEISFGILNLGIPAEEAAKEVCLLYTSLLQGVKERRKENENHALFQNTETNSHVYGCFVRYSRNSGGRQRHAHHGGIPSCVALHCLGNSMHPLSLIHIFGNGCKPN